MASTAPIYTVEDLQHLDGEYELDRGRLVEVMPGGWDHSVLCGRVYVYISNFVGDNRLGQTLCNDPGFILERGPDTLRGPDVAFVRAERVPEMRSAGSGFPSGAPDLAVEVLGSGASVPQAIHKASQYLGAGCRLVWLMDISQRRVLEFHLDGITRTLTEKDALEGGSVLPGFNWPLSDLFADL